MLAAAQSPLMSGHDQLDKRPKSSRKPLQPKNPQASNTPISHKSKPKCNEIEIITIDDSNKENLHPIYYSITTSTPAPVITVKKESFQIEGSLDVSLADELISIREKLERLRIDKEKTEKMLEDRGLKLDLKMKDILYRGQVQKQHEIEVDRLFRLNEIRLTCLQRISPVRSLRDKELEKKIKQDQLKANIKTEGSDENSEVNAENK